MMPEKLYLIYPNAKPRCKYFNNCNCKKQNEIPRRVHEFLLNQRTTTRVDYIGHLNAEYTSNIQKSIERKKTFTKTDELNLRTIL